MGRGVTESCQDGLDHTFLVVVNVIVPEAQNTKSLISQMAITFSINLFRMLTAICFNDQPRLQADEIDNIMVDRLLPFELEASEPLSAKQPPEP